MKSWFILSLCGLFSMHAIAQLATVQGKIINPKGEMAYLKYYQDFITYDEITIDSDSLDAIGMFSMDFTWPTAGYLTFAHGDEITAIYLAPGDNLHLTLDTEAFDESIHYTGTGEKVNNYLAAKYLASDQPTREYYLVTADEFSTRVNATRDEKLAMVNAVFAGRADLSEQEKRFLSSEQNSIQYDAALQKLSYPGYHQYLTNNFEYKPDPSYYDFLNEIPLMNDEALAAHQYHSFLNSFVDYKWHAALQAQADADPVELQKSIIDHHFQGYQRDFLYAGMLHELIQESASFAKAEAMYAILKPTMQTASLITLLDNAFDAQRLLAVGMPVPAFTANDVDGNPVRLSAYQGKVVYLDIWATWCGPCIGEIPAMEKLIHTMEGKEVVFLAVSVDENENAWKKMLKDKNLLGEHAISPGNFNSSIAKAFRVNGIPRYVLIDKTGKIANANAPRPGQVSADIEYLLAH